MLDAVTLDQLRTFIAAAEEGSFSAAGRKLRRAQSVVSQTLANLEGQFGVKLFDRSRRRPVLTPQGKVLLTHARTVAGDIARLKAHAKLLAGGLESEVSIAVDVMFPMDALTAAVTAFHAAFPLTPLRLYAETLGAVLQTLLPASELLHHIQLVLTDRSTLSAGQELGIMSARTWRLADLGAKHAFLRAGLGWGGMPEESVRSDLARGSLVRLVIEDAPPAGFAVSMRAVYRTDAPPGIAARWLIERLKERKDEDQRGGQRATTTKSSRRRTSAKPAGGSAPRAGR
jgi:DNA-binding transcriptional LysR family regulator